MRRSRQHAASCRKGNPAAAEPYEVHVAQAAVAAWRAVLGHALEPSDELACTWLVGRWWLDHFAPVDLQSLRAPAYPASAGWTRSRRSRTADDEVAWLASCPAMLPRVDSAPPVQSEHLEVDDDERLGDGGAAGAEDRAGHDDPDCDAGAQQAGDSRRRGDRLPRDPLRTHSLGLANITCWGPTLVDEFGPAVAGLSVVFLSEHRARELGLRKAIHCWHGLQYRVFEGAAAPTDAGSTSSGVALLVKAHFAVEWAILDGERVSTPRVAAAVWTWKGAQVLLIVVYLQHSTGLDEVNTAVLVKIARLAILYGLPFIIGGDWNMDVTTLMSSSVFRDLRAAPIAPATIADRVTCKPSSEIDYFIVSEGLRALFSCSTVSWQVPWAPHGLVQVELRANPTTQTMVVQRVPRPLPQPSLSGPWLDWDAALALSDELLPRWFGKWPQAVVGFIDSHDEASAIWRATGDVSRWALAAELQILSAASTPAADWYAYCGRGQPPEWRTQPFRVRGPHHEASTRVAWWQHAVTRIGQASRDCPQSAPAARWLRTCSPPAFAPKRAQTQQQAAEAWTHWVAKLQAAGVDRLDPVAAVELVHQASGRLEAERRRLKRLRDQRWKEWAQSAIEGGAGAAHRVSKSPEPPSMSLVGSGPIDTMCAKVATWGGLWTRDAHEFGQVRARLTELRRRALAEAPAKDPTPAELQRMQQIVTHMPRRKCGLDCIDATTLSMLPHNGCVEHLSLLLHRIRSSGVLVAQIYQVLVGLLDKPLAAGDRPISLTSYLYRAIVRYDKPAMQKYEAAHTGTWDYAVSAGGAVTAVWESEAMFEISNEEHQSLAMVLLDMAKFFDRIGWLHLIDDAVNQDFPILFLIITIELYTSPRMLQKYAILSAWILPANSVTAGCGRAVTLIRNFVYKSCFEAHTCFPDRVFIRQFIDDICIAAVGHAAIVGSLLCRVAVPFIKSMQAKRCVLSDKSVILGSDRRIRTSVAYMLAKKGIRVVQSHTARDLGIDVCLNKRRSCKVAGSRLKKAKARGVRANMLFGKSTGRASKLHRAGTYPAALFGHPIKGTAPTVLRGLRAILAESFFPGNRSGMSSTAIVQIAMGPMADPGVAVPVGVVCTYIARIARRPDLLLRVEPLWPRMLARIHAAGQQHRWQYARGPFTGVICTLLDIGWTPSTPSEWVSPTGERCILDSACSLKQAAELIRESAIVSCWGRTEGGHLGDGISLGVLVDTMHKQYLKIRAKDPLQAKLNLRVWAGGWWTEARRHESEMIPSDLCIRCGRCPGTLYHHVWECNQLDTSHPDIEASQHLVPKALASSRDHIAYWCRGILLKPCLPALPEPDDYCYSIGVDPSYYPADAILCLDGSGGRDAREHTLLRRVSWAWTLMGADGSPIYGRMGGLSGKQSVPRAELRALQEAGGWLQQLHCARSNMDPEVPHACMFTDHLNISRRFLDLTIHSGWPDTRASDNHEAWEGVRAAMSLSAPIQMHPSAGLVHAASTSTLVAHVLKIKSHLTEYDLLHDHAHHGAIEIIGNEIADGYAEVAADHLALDAELRKKFQTALDEWSLVHRRIAAVYQQWRTSVPDEWMQPNYHVRPPRPRAISKFAIAISESSHRVTSMHGRLVCNRCMGFSNKGRSHKYQFLASHCDDINSFKPHCTHRVRFAIFTSIFRCIRCGADVGQPRQLRSMCRPIQGIQELPQHDEEEGSAESSELELIDPPANAGEHEIEQPCEHVDLPANAVGPVPHDNAHDLDDSQADPLSEPDMSDIG